MLTRKNLAILSLTLLLLTKGMCQIHINGVVTTKDSIKIPFATITLYADSTALQSVICDSNGRFQLPVQRNITTPLFVRAFYKQLASGKVPVNQSTEWLTVIINDPVKVLSAVTIEADVSRISRRGDRFVFVPSRSLAKGSDAFEMLLHVPLIKVEDQSDAFSIINKSGTVVY